MVIYPSITKTSYTILFLLVNTLWINLSSAQSPFDVVEKSIVQLQQALASGETTSFELVELYLARIQAYDKQGPRLNSLIRQNRGAMQRARDLDAERAASGARGLLHGIPVIIKDNYNTDDMPTSGGSVALAGFVPNATATQVVKLRNAGAIILAKSNLHEYAYGITTISSLGGQTRNPYDLRRVPGGSSGGTAAAVAASFAAVGMGSDTCGSIRIPSAFNNLIGLRPSKGLSSIYGIMPLSHTQDVAGPLARSAVDLAIVLDAVAGFDSADAATSLMQNNQPLEFYAQLESMSLDGLRIAKLSSYFDAADSAMIAVIEQALQRFEQLGAEIIEVDIAGLSSLIARSGLIGHEFKTDLNQYLAHFGSTEIQDLATIVDKGLYHGAVRGALVRSQAGVVNQESYAAALLVREELRQAIEAVLEEQQIDVIVYPSIAQLQSFTGESQPGNNCSISANSGLPALAMPAGFTGSGLPVGLELLGGFLDDAKLLSIAHQFAQQFPTRQAPSTTPALVNGLAPVPQLLEFDSSASNVDLHYRFSIDVVSNNFSYELDLSGGEIYAATLSIDAGSDAISERDGAIVLNLIGPQTRSVRKQFFMTPDFRQALLDNRLTVKVFASHLPASGHVQSLPSLP